MGVVLPVALAQQAVKETAATSPSSAAGRYPAGSIQSVTDADDALADMAKERAEIEARYVAEEQACLPKFFATSCIEQAQERRRAATMQLRAVELEANTFKRRARVAERDKALEERRRQDESEGAERARRQQEAASARANQETVSPTEEDPSRKAPVGPADREKRHQAKRNRERAEEADKAQERAENVAKYERKVQAVKARQQEIASRKAEKEKKRQQKQEPAGSQ